MTDRTTTEPSGIDVSNADHLLSTTRAVRKRLDLDRPVPREVILDCLRIATQAPTASNEQTWRWVVVTEADKRQAIADHYREAGRAYLEKAATDSPPGQTRRVYASALYLTEILHRVPVHVIACVEGRFDGAPHALAAAAYGSILPAAWSFQLALRARGLGSVWTTLHLFREKEIAALLGIPETVSQVALFPVAFTTGGDFRPATRPPVEDVTHWNGWGNHPTAAITTER